MREEVSHDKALPKNELNKLIDKKAKVFIVTDSGLPNAYIRALKQSIKNSNVYVHIINKGEKAKSFKNYQQILKKLIDLKFSRTDLIVALGGGVVGRVHVSVQQKLLDQVRGDVRLDDCAEGGVAVTLRVPKVVSQRMAA